MDNRAAAVTCRQLGHTQYHWDAEPDSGYGTLLNYSLVQNVTCTGSEVSLSQCNVYDAQDDCLPWCPDRNIGLRCFTPAECEDVGSIRLTGGQQENEGTVQVCYKNVWGLIVAMDWSEDEAAVVCHHLGYSRTGAVSITDSRYGNKSDHDIVIVGAVTCSGSEDIFDDCDVKMIPIEDGSQLVTHVNVSGVVCAGSASAPNTRGNTNVSVAVGITTSMLLVVIAVLIGVVVFAYIRHKMKQGSLPVRSVSNPMNDDQIKKEPAVL